MIRSIGPCSLIGFVATVSSAACPVSFQTQSAASLTPTASSHIVLLRQSNGSFTGYEVQNAAPFAVLNTIPEFQNQLTLCPPPPAGVSPSLTAPQAFAQLSAGGYLFLQRGNANAISAMQFTSALSLVSQSTLTLAGSGIASTLAVTDVNGDGVPDIIAGAGYAQAYAIQVLLGKGGTSFQSPVSYPVSEIYIQGMALVDVNGDGKLDIVIVGPVAAGAESECSVLLGNGDGTFQPEKVVLTSGTSNFLALAIADVNADGKPDLAITLGNSASQTAVIVALGKGDGTFASPVSYPSGGSDSIAIADVNGDGFPDIVASGISILFGDGTGAFPNRRDYLQQTPGNIILTDFNGDGKTDIVIGTGASWILAGAAVAVMYGNGDGTFSGAPVSAVPATPGNMTTAMQSADLDGDGIQDLVISEYTSIFSLHGRGDGNFTLTWQDNTYNVETSVGTFVNGIAIGDFNRDGIPDFTATMASPSGGSIAVFLGVGDGTFQPPLLIPLAGALGSPGAIFAVDLNNDGKLDLALVATPFENPVTSALLTCLGNGDGTFAAPVTQMTVSGTLSIAPGDFNNDGIPDLGVATVAPDLPLEGIFGIGGSVTVLLGVGDGTFRTAPSVSFPDIQSTVTLVAADFNLDGKRDLALFTTVGAPTTAELAILLSNGDGTFQSPLLNTVSAAPGGPIVADLNGDGIPDLVTGGGYLLGNGDGTFQSQVSQSFYALLAADFNGDGQIDLAGYTYIGASVMLNNSRPAAFTVVSAASFQTGPVAPESLVSAFGSNLASSSQPGSTSVTVTDAAGVSQTASLLFVSPGQINFQVPAGTSPGATTVTITSGTTSISSPADIAPVTPALFTLNRAGLAAAYAVLVSGSEQTVEPVFTIQNGAAVAAPIRLGSAGEQVYLSLFGTGIRNAAAGSVSVRINGVNAAVSYAGPQQVMPGLDQVNVLVPPQLAGAGEVGVALTAGGHTANTAYVLIQ